MSDARTTGIIIVDHGSRRPESNEMLEQVAAAFAARFDECDIVEPAHMELAMPDIAAAYGRCVERGAKHVVLVPFFLAKGKHWTRDIPSLTSQAAEAFPGTTYALAEPLLLDDLILDLLKKRFDTVGQQPTVAAGEADPRVEDQSPTQRRVQCATCPFRVEADGTIVIRPESGVSRADLANRAAGA